MAFHDNVTRFPAGRVQAPSFEDSVRDHLDRVLHSPHFDGAARSREFLRYVVNEVLAGRGSSLNQGAIAVTVFHRTADFDAVLDPIVRVQAGRLRRSLERYYLLTGDTESLRIELPKGSYAPEFVGSALPHDHTHVVDAHLEQVQRAVSDWPTVVVHPFVASGDAGGDTSARLNDALVAELCRYGDMRVVRERDLTQGASQRAARFELGGGLRIEGGDRVVHARLVDRSTGEQLWCDEFHTTPRSGRWFGTIDDIGRIIAARVGAEHGVIARLLASEQGVRPIHPSGDFGAIVRCYRFFFSRQLSELQPTLAAVRELTAREPGIAVAWTYLARLSLANHSFELSNQRTSIDEAIGCAYQGVMIEPTGARARSVLAATLLVKGELHAALHELEMALSFNADSLAYREIIGWLMAFAGDWESGMAIVRDALRRNPYCLPHSQLALWADHLRCNDLEAAYVTALEYRDTSFFWREMMTTCCLGLLGRTDEACMAATQLLIAKPSFRERGRTLIGYYIKPPELRQRIFAGLSAAGLQLS